MIIPVLGLQYRDMSMWEIITVFNGTLKRRNDDYDHLNKVTLNAHRWVIFHNMLGNPYINKADKPKKPQDVITFDWEDQSERRQPPSKEQWEEWDKRFPDTI